MLFKRVSVIVNLRVYNICLLSSSSSPFICLNKKKTVKLQHKVMKRRPQETTSNPCNQACLSICVCILQPLQPLRPSLSVSVSCNPCNPCNQVCLSVSVSCKPCNLCNQVCLSICLCTLQPLQQSLSVYLSCTLQPLQPLQLLQPSMSLYLSLNLATSATKPI